MVAVPALFFKMDFFVDLTSVGTFFAFILVCSGVLYMDYSGISKQSKFKVPYVNGRYLITVGLLIAIFGVYHFGKDTITEWRNMPIADILEHKLLIIIFWLVWVVLCFMGYRHRFSLLPVAGILVILYLM